MLVSGFIQVQWSSCHVQHESQRDSAPPAQGWSPRRPTLGNVPLGDNSNGVAPLIETGHRDTFRTANILHFPFPEATGPRPFRRGDMVLRSGKTLMITGFNGAAPFRARRQNMAYVEHTENLYASTGPRPFGRGDSTPGPVATRSPCRFNGAAPFRARRPGEGDYYRSLQGSLQRGRALSGAETRACGTFMPASPTLQRGRALSGAETEQMQCALLGAAAASTGPRPFGRGDTPHARTLRPRSRSFNGAAPFRARRPKTNLITPLPVIGLQRGRALSGAETAVVRVVVQARE